MEHKNLLCLRRIFHSICVSYYMFSLFYGIYCLVYVSDEVAKRKSVSNMRRFVLYYYTNWSMIAATAYFSAALIYDLIETYASAEFFKSKPVRVANYLKNIFYGSSFITIVPNVTVYFWVHYCINRDYVFPLDLEAAIPGWLNHFFHTYPSLLLLGECFVDPKPRPVNQTVELLINTVISFAYLTVYLGVYFIYGIYLYEVHYNVLWITIIDLAGCILSTYVYYFAVYALNRFIYGKICTENTEKPKHTTPLQAEQIINVEDEPDKNILLSNITK